jgi:MFS family permease
VSLYFFSYFQRIGVPGMIFDEIQIDLGLTASGVALLGATYLYVYGGMQYFVGIISDRYGFARVFFVGSIAMAVGSILFPLCHSIPLLYTARAIIGVGSSLLFICMAKAIAHFFDLRYFAIMLSIAQFLGFFGGLTATYPLAALTHAIGWRKSLLLAGVVTVVLTLILTWILRRRNLLAPVPAKPVALKLIKQVVRLKELWKLTCAGSITFAIYFVAQATIGKKLLADCFKLTTSESAGFMFVMLSVSIFATLCSGFALKFFKQRYRPLLLLGWFINALCCAGLIIALCPGVHSLTLVKICYLGLAIASFAGPIYTTGVTTFCSTESLGTAISVLNGTLYIVISIMANGSGVILDIFQKEAIYTPTAWIYPPEAYRLVFIACLTLCCLALPAIWRLRQKHA